MTCAKLILLGPILAAAYATGAQACSPPPAKKLEAPKRSRVEMEAVARKLYREAAYIAKVVVERSPRFKTNRDTKPPAPGLLRVVAVMKGHPPQGIEVPSPDPCSLYFMRTGTTWYVMGTKSDRYPRPLASVTIALLRKQKVGEFRKVR